MLHSLRGADLDPEPQFCSPAPASQGLRGVNAQTVYTPLLSTLGCTLREAMGPGFACQKLQMDFQMVVGWEDGSSWPDFLNKGLPAALREGALGHLLQTPICRRARRDKSGADLCRTTLFAPQGQLHTGAALNS